MHWEDKKMKHIISKVKQRRDSHRQLCHRKLAARDLAALRHIHLPQKLHGAAHGRNCHCLASIICHVEQAHTKSTNSSTAAFQNVSS
jgi:hypothetical protein